MRPTSKMLLATTALLLVTLPLSADSTSKDIVGVASEAGTFQTLLAAAGAAGLVEALQADGPLTVFAPNDEAFAKLPAGTVENLLQPENKAQLAAILTFHVVSGKVLSSDLSDGATAPTLQGQELTFAIDDDGVKVGDANVIAADVEASNGVIHVIDAVLLP